MKTREIETHDTVKRYIDDRKTAIENKDGSHADIRTELWKAAGRSEKSVQTLQKTKMELQKSIAVRIAEIDAEIAQHQYQASKLRQAAELITAMDAPKDTEEKEGYTVNWNA
jgi:hypothetical protein